TGKEQKIQITAPNKMSEDDINKKMSEAKAHEEEDKKRLEQVQVLNEAEATVYSSEKTLKEYADKIPAELKTQIEEKVAKLKEAHQKQDVQACKPALEELKALLSKIGESVYGQKGQPGQPGAGQAPPNGEQPHAEPKNKKGGDDTIDADFKKK
ncbi:MAG: Hsp70 family protein, partial [Candidatus Micrarchaeota archaeon]